MDKNLGFEIEARGDREIVMTRLFNAPRRLVFDAWTRAELLMRWFGGPREWSLTVCEIDLRVGGAYRFVTTRTDGREMGWGGVYLEIAAPERLVFTETFDEAWYPGDAVVTIELAEKAGKTIFVSTQLHGSREARDGVLKSPMDTGVGEGFRRLDEFLDAIQAGQK